LSRFEFRRRTEKPPVGFHSDCTTAPSFCSLELGANVSQQNERIALGNVDMVWRQITYINHLDEVELVTFKQSGAIGQRFDEFPESRWDAEILGHLTFPLLQLVVDLINELIFGTHPLTVERKKIIQLDPGTWRHMIIIERTGRC
jgi:hypothetical protein